MRKFHLVITFILIICIISAGLLLFIPAYFGHGQSSVSSDAVSEDCDSVIEEMILAYGQDPGLSDSDISGYLKRIKAADRSEYNLWKKCMESWKYINEDLVINTGFLPDSLPKDDSLCIIVLGYQLNSDGSMRSELIHRLDKALECAAEYPEAYILVTGGGTASLDSTATEADCMASYLIENGISDDRLIIENKSYTTAQNAMYSLKILNEDYPGVSSIVLTTSDNHITWAYSMFSIWLILNEDKLNGITLDGHAAYKTDGSTTYSVMSQASGVSEFIGKY